VKTMTAGIFVSIGLTLLFVSQGLSAEPLQLVTLQYPPYQYEEEGELRGFVATIVKEVFKRMNQPIKIKVYPFARALTMVKDGNADAIFTAARNAEREVFADFPGEVLIGQRMSLFANMNFPMAFDGDLSKWRQYRFGVINGYRYGNVFDDAVKNGILPNIEQTDSPESNAKKLVAGRIDVWMSNREQALFTIRTLRLSDAVKELKPEVQVIPSYLAFSKKRKLGSVMQRFDMELRKMKDDGTYERIISEYWKSNIEAR
jgi:polar amino acid transport system substrate-binding protein